MNIKLVVRFFIYFVFLLCRAIKFLFAFAMCVCGGVVKCEIELYIIYIAQFYTLLDVFFLFGNEKHYECYLFLLLFFSFLISNLF